VEYRSEQYRRERGAGFSFDQMEVALAGLPQFGACSPRTKGRLYLLLRCAGSEYEMRTAFKKAPSVGAVKDELEDIRRAINRVVEFGRSAFGEITYREAADSAVTLIVAKANASADYSFVREFFERASLIEKFANGAAKDAARSAAERSDGRLEMTPIQRLAGRRLPEIYERIFKETFGASVSIDGGGGGPGITFVISALKLLGVRPPRGDMFAPNTIKNHVAAARRATD
jgi:hypothetical protein